MCERRQATERTQDLSLSAARAACGQAKPGLVRGHHLSTPSRQICFANRLPGNGCVAGSSIWWRFFARQSYAQHDPEMGGLAHPDGSVVAHLEHAGGRLLRRSAERGELSVRTARHHEQR